MSLKPQTRDLRLKVRPRELVLRIFTFGKNPSTSAKFETANLGTLGEHVTLRPPRFIYIIGKEFVARMEEDWTAFKILQVNLQERDL